uniref:Uncharacterized protein n=1 Tax=Arundo donax TaxID=35708 RepID=A0A0A8ZPR6_ARUDO
MSRYQNMNSNINKHKTY